MKIVNMLKFGMAEIRDNVYYCAVMVLGYMLNRKFIFGY